MNKDFLLLKVILGIKDLLVVFVIFMSFLVKNVIKKKGEIIILWIRNDDWEILLEC